MQNLSSEAQKTVSRLLSGKSVVITTTGTDAAIRRIEEFGGVVETFTEDVPFLGSITSVRVTQMPRA